MMTRSYSPQSSGLACRCLTRSRHRLHLRRSRPLHRGRRNEGLTIFTGQDATGGIVGIHHMNDSGAFVGCCRRESVSSAQVRLHHVDGSHFESEVYGITAQLLVAGRTESYCRRAAAELLPPVYWFHCR